MVKIKKGKRVFSLSLPEFLKVLCSHTIGDGPLEVTEVPKDLCSTPANNEHPPTDSPTRLRAA